MSAPATPIPASAFVTPARFSWASDDGSSSGDSVYYTSNSTVVTPAPSQDYPPSPAVMQTSAREVLTDAELSILRSYDFKPYDPFTTTEERVDITQDRPYSLSDLALRLAGPSSDDGDSLRSDDTICPSGPTRPAQDNLVAAIRPRRVTRSDKRKMRGSKEGDDAKPRTSKRSKVNGAASMEGMDWEKVFFEEQSPSVRITVEFLRSSFRSEDESIAGLPYSPVGAMQRIRCVREERWKPLQAIVGISVIREATYIKTRVWANALVLVLEEKHREVAPTDDLDPVASVAWSRAQCIAFISLHQQLEHAQVLWRSYTSKMLSTEVEEAPEEGEIDDGPAEPSVSKIEQAGLVIMEATSHLRMGREEVALGQKELLDVLKLSVQGGHIAIEDAGQFLENNCRHVRALLMCLEAVPMTRFPIEE